MSIFYYFLLHNVNKWLNGILYFLWTTFASHCGCPNKDDRHAFPTDDVQTPFQYISSSVSDCNHV